MKKIYPFIGIFAICAIILFAAGFRAFLAIAICSAVGTAFVWTVARLLYPENDLDDKIDLK